MPEVAPYVSKSDEKEPFAAGPRLQTTVHSAFAVVPVWIQITCHGFYRSHTPALGLDVAVKGDGSKWFPNIAFVSRVSPEVL